MIAQEARDSASTSHDRIHVLTVAGVYQAMATSREGLSSDEARERLLTYGLNAVSEQARRPLVLQLLANMTHLMALLLWLGGIVALIAQLPQLAIAIWLVNLINGGFSFWQEYRAERATAALRRLLAPSARVLRGGQEQRIPAEEIVPGDLLLLAEGERVAADARVVQATGLRVDQAMLSGEAHPVHKTSELLDQEGLSRAELANLVFAGTSVMVGTGTAVVFATGMATELGKLAHLTQTIGAEPSPLQKEMDRVTKVIAALAVAIGLVFFVLAILLAGVDLAESFIFALGMIVAFVPEGLLPTVTLSLALGVQRMARRHALVKRLSAVETLGCTTVICTDKTGTLTQNEMTVRTIWCAGREYAVAGVGYEPEGPLTLAGNGEPAPLAPALRDLLRAGALCCNARLLPPSRETPRWTALGDPTEAAILVAAEKAGLDLEQEAALLPRTVELPFEARRKRMATIHQPPGGPALAFVKGAPKELLALCCTLQLGEQTQPLSEERSAAVLEANDRYARAGLRVLAVATRELLELRAPAEPAEVEQDLTFLGLLAMHDPPRPEVAHAVESCHRAGIRIIMVTGDYGLTAESIARGIGMLRGERPRIITGAELDRISNDELQAALQDEVVFARVAPEQKLLIVQTLQSLGQIVAVTGDGVNDAPALKQADIGVAMGLAGTDVAKEAADMILTDDNFASIVHAVEEGRAVYENIRKFSLYVLTSNTPEAVPFVAMLFSRGAIPLPLTIMQVLSVDLGTDMLPAIGLGAEPPGPGLMERPPRSQAEPLLQRGLLLRALLWYGMLEALAGMSAYFYANWLYGWPGVPLAAEGTPLYRLATTMTLAAVVATQIGAVFARRSEQTSLFRLGSNRLILAGVALEVALLAALSYIPILQSVFGTAPLGLREWAFILAWVPLIPLVDELRKLLRPRRAPVRPDQASAPARGATASR